LEDCTGECVVVVVNNRGPALFDSQYWIYILWRY